MILIKHKGGFTVTDIIKKEAHDAVEQIIEAANLKSGSIFIVGCSTSEILGQKIGTMSSFDTAKEVLESGEVLLPEKNPLILSAVRDYQHDIFLAFCKESFQFQKEFPRFLSDKHVDNDFRDSRIQLCRGIFQQMEYNPL